MYQYFERSQIVIDLTKSVNKEPTNPTPWVHRAHQLNMMGYAELAAGDAWKAILLIDLQVLALRNQQVETTAVEAGKRLDVLIGQLRTAYQELIGSLDMLQDYQSLSDICEEGIGKYGRNSQDFFVVHRASAMANVREIQERSKMESVMSKGQKDHYQHMYGADESNVRLQSGWTQFLPYPFMPAKYLVRQDDTVKEAQALFQLASSSCELSYSNVSGISDISPNVLGVFATRDISPSEHLLEDFTAIAACEVSASAPSTVSLGGTTAIMCDNCYGQTTSTLSISPDCCRTSYCSQRCLDLALSTYHKVLCGKNFDWLYQEAQKKPRPLNLNGPIWLRILATCVQSRQHPLEHPAIARLVPCYSTGCRKWSFVANYTQPTRILKQLGINPFKDRRYETWVLQTIWARVVNNQDENPSGIDGNPVRTISPLYCFFNHSCERNAGWSGKTEEEHPYCSGGSTKVFHAKRQIKKGEEICVSYVAFSGRETKEERLEVTMSWFGVGGECGCSKCRRET